MGKSTQIPSISRSKPSEMLRSRLHNISAEECYSRAFELQTLSRSESLEDQPILNTRGGLVSISPIKSSTGRIFGAVAPAKRHVHQPTMLTPPATPTKSIQVVDNDMTPGEVTAWA